MSAKLAGKALSYSILPALSLPLCIVLIIFIYVHTQL